MDQNWADSESNQSKKCKLCFISFGLTNLFSGYISNWLFSPNSDKCITRLSLCVFYLCTTYIVVYYQSKWTKCEKRSTFHGKLKWFNLQSLSRRFQAPSIVVVYVKMYRYFRTKLTRSHTRVLRRQRGCIFKICKLFNSVIQF